MPVYLIRVVQIMLEIFVQGACLAYVKDRPFFIPLSIAELFNREAAALPVLPSLVIGTETKYIYLPRCFEMQYFYRLLETHLKENTSLVIVTSSVTRHMMLYESSCCCCQESMLLPCSR